jgi:hypothetical protein
MVPLPGSASYPRDRQVVIAKRQEGVSQRGVLLLTELNRTRRIIVIRYGRATHAPVIPLTAQVLIERRK